MARMRRLESDVQDPSSELFTNVRLVLENWTKPYIQPSATPSSLIFFFFWMWSVVVPTGGVVHPRVLALRYPGVSGSAALLVLEPEKHVVLSNMEADFSSSSVNPCSNGPQEWSPKNELHSEVALYIHYHKIVKDEGVAYSHQHIFDYLFGILNCRICKLHNHVCWERSRVLKFFKNYFGHYVHA